MGFFFCSIVYFRRKTPRRFTAWLLNSHTEAVIIRAVNESVG